MAGFLAVRRARGVTANLVMRFRQKGFESLDL
jgi:hypothetical protein